MSEVKEELDGMVRAMENIEVRLEDVLKKINKMSNWKASGPNGVQGYWFKAFDCLHKPKVNALQKCIANGDVPEWMVNRRTVLIQKDPAKSTEASNYKPIACLPLTWKLLSGIFVDRVCQHLLETSSFQKNRRGAGKSQEVQKTNSSLTSQF